MDERGMPLGLNAAAERVLDRERIVLLCTRIAERAGLAALPELTGLTIELPALMANGREEALHMTVSRTGDSPPSFTVWIGEPAAHATELPGGEQGRALLEAAEELAQIGSWEWIPDMSELVWSDNLYRIFDLEPGEVEPSPEYVFERTHPDDRDRVARQVAQLEETGALPPLEYRIVRADGVVKHLRATLTVAEWRDDRPFRLVGWVQDQTERHRAEREIAAHYAVAEALSAWEGLDQGGHPGDRGTSSDGSSRGGAGSSPRPC
jgi:PAS domain S-box-containing protein